MDAWERWWLMAQGSLKAAQLLAAQREIAQREMRSSASRAYYATYQFVTAILLYHNMTPPDGREAWTHDATPELIWRLSNAVITHDARKDVASRLRTSYALRVIADYVSGEEVREIDLKTALKNASFVARLASDVLS